MAAGALHRLRTTLAVHAPAAAANLANALGVSVPTLHAPLPQQRVVWHAAGDGRISAGFRKVCMEHAGPLSAAAEHA